MDLIYKPMVLAPKPFAPVKKEEIIRFENFIMKLSLQFLRNCLVGNYFLKK